MFKRSQHWRQRKQAQRALATGAGQRASEPWIGQERRKDIAKGARIGAWHQHAGYSVLDDFGRAAAARRNNWPVGHHAFYEDAAERLWRG